jgi:predicted transcriptional regulator of viral defense system
VEKNTLHEFFDKFQVFRLEDLNGFIQEKEPDKELDTSTKKNLITHYIKQGRIVRIKQEIYQVIPPGKSSENYSVDPYLLASKLSDDSVLSHHTALEAHAKAYSIFNTFYYWTRKEIKKPFEYQGIKFQAVKLPSVLIEKKKENFATKTLYRKDQPLRVTNFERTLVDVLYRPKFAGNWEEIYRSLAGIDYFDIDEVFEYCKLLGNSTVFARVGFYLEQHQQKLAITDIELENFAQFKPKSPHYLQRQDREKTKKKVSTLLKKWNLVVPNKILEKSWEESL